jgi:hypothetical protein
MAARAFTVDSLAAGGRWGHPGRLPTPAPRRAAPTGGEWEDGQIDYDDKEKSWVQQRAFGVYGIEPSDAVNVHKPGFIGAKVISSGAAQALENAVSKALDDYIEKLREAYTYTDVDGSLVCGLDRFSPGEIQPIARGYLAVKAATRDLIDVRADQASIEAPFEVLSAEFTEGGKSDWGDGKCFPRSATRACLCCTVFSVLLGAGALAVAGVYYAWGGRNYGDEANHGLSPGDDGYTALPIFWDGNFWGWPKEKVFRNIWCGLMLGIVFGFLDNFGLFYGTSALDATFYSIGNKIASGLLASTPKGSMEAGEKGSQEEKKMRELALTAHKITEDMMAGLGNTFRCAVALAAPNAFAARVAHPARAAQRPPRRRPRHRRPRDCQGRPRRRALLVARRPARHRARLPAGRLPPRARQVQERRGAGEPRIQVLGRALLHRRDLRVGALRRRARRPPGRLPVDHRRLARIDHRHPFLPGRLHPAHPALQRPFAVAQAAVGGPAHGSGFPNPELEPEAPTAQGRLGSGGPWLPRRVGSLSEALRAESAAGRARGRAAVVRVRRVGCE